MFLRPAPAPSLGGAGFFWQRLEPSGGAGCSSTSKKAGSGPACAPSDGCQAPAQKPPCAKDGGGPWQGAGNRRLPRSGSPKGSSQPAGLLPYSLKKAPRQAARGDSLGVYGL